MRNRLALIALLCVLALAPPAFAINGCGNHFLRGAYGYQISGTDANSVAAVGYGRMVLDGTGVIREATITVAVAGASQDTTATGTYSVGSDCSVTFKFKDALGVTSNFVGVVVRGGDDVMFSQSDDGVALQGTLQRTHSACYGQELNASLGFRLSTHGGTQVVGLVSPRPGALLDVTEWVMTDGKTKKFTTTGSYKVNSDCTATITLDAVKSGKDSADKLSFKGILTNDGKDFLAIHSDKNMALHGNFAAQ